MTEHDPQTPDEPDAPERTRIAKARAERQEHRFYVGAFDYLGGVREREGLAGWIRIKTRIERAKDIAAVATECTRGDTSVDWNDASQYKPVANLLRRKS